MLAGEDDAPSSSSTGALLGSQPTGDSSQSTPPLLRPVKQEVKEEPEEISEPVPPAPAAPVDIPAPSDTPNSSSTSSVAVKQELIDAVECSSGGVMAVWSSGGTSKKSARGRKSSRRSKAKKPKLQGQGSAVRTSTGASPAAGMQLPNATQPIAGTIGMENLSQVEREKVGSRGVVEPPTRLITLKPFSWSPSTPSAMRSTVWRGR